MDPRRDGERLGGSAPIAGSVVDLMDLFARLEPPMGTAGLRFAAAPIEGFEEHRIGKDAESNASFLIRSIDLEASEPVPPIVLEHLSVQHDVECRITHLDGSGEVGRFTLVRCTDADPMLERHFLRVVGALVAELGRAPRKRDVARSIQRLVSLFQAMSTTSRRTVQGLWAELLLIAGARDAARLVAAWHVRPDDRYDFSEAADRIEVKSAVGRVRQHRFALSQVTSVPQTNVVVASVLVERAGAGVSVGDLFKEVRNQVADKAELVLHVDEVVLATLGSSWRVALEERFDRHLAESSLRF